MASITASLRLRFFADDAPLRQAIGTMRQAASVAAGMDGRKQKKQEEPDGMLGLGKSKKAFALAGNINQAASAMQGFKATLDSLTRGPIDKFAEFETMMARVKARTDNVSDDSFAKLKKAAEDAGASTAFTATEAAEGLFELSGAGLTAEQQVAALPAVLNLALSAQMGLGQATSIATNTMAQFGLTVKDIPTISDELNQAANLSTISLSDLGQTMKYVGPVAAAAGLSLRTTATMAALLGNAGIQSDQAGTSLRGMLLGLAAPSKKAGEALKKVGLSSKAMAEGVKDPIAFLQKLGGAFQSKKMDAAARLGVVTKIFGRETASAVMSLIDAGMTMDAAGKTAFDNMSEGMTRAEGSTNKLAETLSNTTGGKIEAFKSSLEALTIQLGENFAPALLQMQRDLGPVIEKFGSWIKENPRLVSTLGRVMILTSGILAVLIPFTLGIGALVSAYGVLGPVIRGVLIPLRMFGGMLAGTQTGPFANGLRQVNTLGQTWSTTAGKMSVGVGIVSAAFAGWELGGQLDVLIAKFFGLREATLSAWAAIELAESKGFNDTIASFADTVGWSSLGDAARANNAINETRTRQDQRGMGTPPPVKVDVTVEDKRTVVKQTMGKADSGQTLRTGTN